MIQVHSQAPAYCSLASSKTHQLSADAPVTKGGGGAGFGAHELLEASLAVCINMTVRMHADKAGITLHAVTTSVQLTRPDAETSQFEYELELSGDLSPTDREALEAAAENCPVRQTLSKCLVFARAEGERRQV